MIDDEGCHIVAPSPTTVEAGNNELPSVGEAFAYTEHQKQCGKDIIISFQVDTENQTAAEKHIEEELMHIAEDNEDLHVIKKKDVEYVETLEKKNRRDIQRERSGSMAEQLSGYGSSLSSSLTSTLYGGYEMVRRNTLGKLPDSLSSVKALKKSTNAIVKRTIQIEMDLFEYSDDEEDEEQEEQTPLEPTSPTSPTNSNTPASPSITQPLQPNKQKRVDKVYVNDRTRNKAKRRRWPNNYIRTSRYRWYSFIFQNLFEQFRRIHNIYFAITLAVQLIPAVSPTIPTSSILPFCIIILLTALKDLYEDVKRTLADRTANSKQCYVLRDGELKRVASKDLEVGDIVRMDRDEVLCADVVCLSTSREDGACYIDTAQLDGETSLKTKRSIASTHSFGNDHAQYKALSGKLIIEKPSANLDRFNGNMCIINNHSKQLYSLDMNNLLLRGCTLRNTKYAYGIIIYVGQDTKLFKNLRTNVAKFSHLDKRLNLITLLMIVMQQFVCWFFTGLSYWFYSVHASNNPYLQPLYRDTKDNSMQNTPTFIVLNYMTFYTLTGMMLPMGLFLALEFIKSFQSRMMEMDQGMTHQGINMQSKTSHLNQGLSQLDIIFSDKTGTLTCNEMHFAKAWIDNMLFDEMNDPGAIRRHMSTLQSDHPQYEMCNHFLWCMALNHSVIPEMNEHSGQVTYDGLSSDEIALLHACTNNGVQLMQRTNAGLMVQSMDTPPRLCKVLAQLDFTSDRKRMTVAVVLPDREDLVVVYCKGADVVMMDLLDASNKTDSLQSALDELSNQGLRTLVMAYKVMDARVFNEWHESYARANALVIGRDQAVQQTALQLETNLFICGCTAIEDRLQEQVPSSVKYLLDAGLQVWMLTGDKTETAINIAYAAGVLQKNETIEIRIRDVKSQRHFEKKMQHAIRFLEEYSTRSDRISFALVIDYRAIRYALLPQNQHLFIRIVSQCKSALCCRCTPKQKAAIVRLVETSQNKRSCAVGDGVNDVAMIQAANIGVGIMGREGSQAARASDYAVPRFKHLVRLLAVHGRYSYIRNSDYLHTSFYKNNALVFIQLLFNFYTGFTGGVMYDSWTITMYNTIFAQVPPLLSGIFEKDLTPEAIMAHPELYPQLKNDALFNVKTFTLWNLIPMVHATIIFFGAFVANSMNNDSILGTMVDDVNSSGTIVMTCMLSVYLLRHMLETKYWTVITAVVFTICYVTYFIWGTLYNIIPHFPSWIVTDTYSYYWAFFASLGSWKAFLIHPVMITMCLLPDLVIKYLKRHYNPDLWEQVLMSDARH